METIEKVDVEMSAPERMYLKPERVQQALEKLPSWRLSEDGLAIETERRFTTSQGASAFARLACRLASKLGQPVKIDVADQTAVVTLTGHPVRGCTGGLNGPVFRLADLIGS